MNFKCSILCYYILISTVDLNMTLTTVPAMDTTTAIDMSDEQLTQDLVLLVLLGMSGILLYVRSLPVTKSCIT
jgi:hypothetical protein